MLLSINSRPEVFYEKGVLRNFAKLTGKHTCQSLFFNKVAGFRSATLLKKRFWHRCFPVNFTKFLRTHFLTEHLQWLLLAFVRLLFVISQLNHLASKIKVFHCSVAVVLINCFDHFYVAYNGTY